MTPVLGIPMYRMLIDTSSLFDPVDAQYLLKKARMVLYEGISCSWGLSCMKTQYASTR